MASRMFDSQGGSGRGASSGGYGTQATFGPPLESGNYTASGSPAIFPGGPSLAGIGMGMQPGMGQRQFDDITNQRSGQGHGNQYSGLSPADAANVDRLNQFYMAGKDVYPALGSAVAIPAYEAAKGLAQNIPGGASAWNHTIGALDPTLGIDPTTSRASMSNVTSGLMGIGAGLHDAFMGYGGGNNPSADNNFYGAYNPNNAPAPTIPVFGSEGYATGVGPTAGTQPGVFDQNNTTVFGSNAPVTGQAAPYMEPDWSGYGPNPGDTTPGAAAPGTASNPAGSYAPPYSGFQGQSMFDPYSGQYNGPTSANFYATNMS